LVDRRAQALRRWPQSRSGSSSGPWIRRLQTRIGCLDLVSSIEALLEVPVGETTFIEALGLHRARLIAHQEFSFDHLQEQYEAKGMHSDDGIAAFVNALRAVQDQTDRLLPTMRNRYPEAAKKWRQPCG
jgi:hypothetical protein